MPTHDTNVVVHIDESLSTGEEGLMAFFQVSKVVEVRGTVNHADYRWEVGFFLT